MVRNMQFKFPKMQILKYSAKNIEKKTVWSANNIFFKTLKFVKYVFLSK